MHVFSLARSLLPMPPEPSSRLEEVAQADAEVQCDDVYLLDMASWEAMNTRWNLRTRTDLDSTTVGFQDTV